MPVQDYKPEQKDLYVGCVSKERLLKQQNTGNDVDENILRLAEWGYDVDRIADALFSGTRTVTRRTHEPPYSWLETNTPQFQSMINRIERVLKNARSGKRKKH